MRIALEGVRVAFGDRVVLDGVSTEFRPGRVHAVVGPSGSGKTTLLGVVAGQHRLTGGSVRVIHDDERTAPPNPDDVVWVPQGANALGGRTVLDNAMIGALATGHDVPGARAAARAALTEVGLVDRAHDQARRLSGGELQRLSLARALASGRRLILVDEPTASLDAANTAMVAEILGRVSTGATVIVATHDEVVVAAAHSVLRLRAR